MEECFGLTVRALPRKMTAKFVFFVWDKKWFVKHLILYYSAMPLKLPRLLTNFWQIGGNLRGILAT